MPRFESYDFNIFVEGDHNFTTFLCKLVKYFLTLLYKQFVSYILELLQNRLCDEKVKFGHESHPSFANYIPINPNLGRITHL